MLNFFDFIVDFFEIIGSFLGTLINSLMTASVIISAGVTIPVVFSGLVPQIISTCMISLVAIAVVKFLLGR